MNGHTHTDTLIAREIRAGRWQSAAAIAGRSEHSLRMAHDGAYRRAFAAAKPAAPEPVVTHKPKVLSSTKVSAKTALQRKRQRLRYDGMRTPATAEFINSCRGRR